MISSSTSSEQALYADFHKLSEMKQGAREESPETIRQVAKQFESLFVQMMLKSMRDTVPENELFGSNSERVYRDMYDKQLSLNIANGKGIGLARVIERQLGGIPEGEQIAKPISEYLSNPRRVESDLRSAVTLSKLQDTRATENSRQPVEDETGDTGWTSAETFIEDVWPYALRAAETLGVEAEVLVAQSALETGWGKHVPLRNDGSNSYNLFGIKADQRWDGDRVDITTREFRHGVMQQEQAAFRAYDSVAEAFEDYVNFIMSSPRYQKALERGYDAEAYARELQQAGYATDPNYARKINRIRSGETLNNHVSEVKNSNEVPLT